MTPQALQKLRPEVIDFFWLGAYFNNSSNIRRLGKVSDPGDDPRPFMLTPVLLNLSFFARRNDLWGGPPGPRWAPWPALGSGGKLDLRARGSAPQLSCLRHSRAVPPSTRRVAQASACVSETGRDRRTLHHHRWRGRILRPPGASQRDQHHYQTQQHDHANTRDIRGILEELKYLDILKSKRREY